MMKTSIRKLGACFNTHRMVREYVETCYLPAHRAGQKLLEGGMAGAKALAAWRSRVVAAWADLSVRIEDSRREKEVPVGAAVGVTVRAKLGSLSADDVSVEVYYGPLDSAGEIRDGAIAEARHDGRDGDGDIFRAEIPCKMTGRYGFAARIVPRHPDLVNALTPLLLTWE